MGLLIYGLMNLTQVPTWATVSPVRENEKIDAAVRICITQKLEALPLPPLDRQDLTPRGFWRQIGTLSVIGYWLVAQVGDTLGPSESLRCPLNVSFRQVRGSLKFIDFTIKKEHKSELKEIISPQQMTLLTPGRIPLGVRFAHPNSYSVWISLGEENETR